MGPGVNEIAVVGAGTMGAGIAQLAASHGCRVHLFDVNRDVLDEAREKIAQHLDRSVSKGRLAATERDVILERIRPAVAIEHLDGVELAIEAVVEDLAAKHGVFADLERTTPRTAVLASNTSSLSITRIAEAVADPGRVVGMHFFNPAPVLPLVEVIAGERSAAESVEWAVAAARAWGKTPVRVKDTPGFIVNRVARGFYLEALRLLSEGVAGVDEIDAVMRTHGSFRMGPFELMDLVGLDVNLAVSTSVWEQLGRPVRLEPHDIQRRLVEADKLGCKTDCGFYRYDQGHKVPAQAVDRRSFLLSPLLSDAMLAFCARAGASHAGSTEQYVFARILAAIMNEAAFAFDEGVASSDGIDLAMQKGTNYPKGPLAWADEVGHRTVRGVLRALNQSAGDGRYEPARLFQQAT